MLDDRVIKPWAFDYTASTNRPAGRNCVQINGDECGRLTCSRGELLPAVLIRQGHDDRAELDDPKRHLLSPYGRTDEQSSRLTQGGVAFYSAGSMVPL